MVGGKVPGERQRPGLDGRPAPAAAGLFVEFTELGETGAGNTAIGRSRRGEPRESFQTLGFPLDGAATGVPALFA